MKKVFLDFGANRCNGMKELTAHDDYDVIECFEPNPVLYSNLLHSFANSNLNIKFHNAAVWKHSGTVSFSLMGNDEASSVECLFNGWGLHENIIQVSCIDVLDIVNQYDAQHQITILMDIEGSEYTVIRRLLEDVQACRKISQMFIEWHAGSVNCSVVGETEASDEDLTTKLLEANPIMKIARWV